MRLSGKTAVITGAGGVIGAATAQAFLAQGANLMLTDHDGAALGSVLEEASDTRVDRIVADVTARAETELVAAKALERFGGIDIFFANAGIEGPVAAVEVYPEDAYHAVMDVNVKGVLIGAQVMLPLMRDGGSVVLTSSIAGLMGAERIIAYAASKHAVIGLRRSLAAGAGKRGIRVNSIHPGFVQSRMLDRLIEASPDPVETRRMYIERTKLGRFTQAEDVANTVVFLASEDSRAITDQAIVIDGGVV